MTGKEKKKVKLSKKAITSIILWWLFKINTTAMETTSPTIAFVKSLIKCLYTFFSVMKRNLLYNAISRPAKTPKNTQVVDIGILFTFWKKKCIIA